MVAKMYPTQTEKYPGRPSTNNYPGSSPVYGPHSSLAGFPDLEGIRSCYELFQNSVRKFPNRPAIGYRRPCQPSPENGNTTAGPFEFLTYSESARYVAAIQHVWQEMGLKPDDRVGVIGPNCPEWFMTMEAMSRMSACCVPLYETLGENAIEFIIQHSDARMVVAQGKKLPAVAKAFQKGASENVRAGVIYWGPADGKDIEAIQGMGVPMLSWDEVIQRGLAFEPPLPIPPRPEDVCTIMYTSGTTGDPKGVLISHKAVIATIAGVKEFMNQHNEELGTKDVYLSYLPLAHIFDRVVEEFMVNVGGSIGYWQGDVKKLLDDVGALRPTLFAGVPRVFERIHGGIQDQVAKSGFLKRFVFGYAYKRKLWYMKSGYRQEEASPVGDRLVFNKIKAKLGGRVRVILTGGAPMPEFAEEFLKVTMGAPLVQGYGLTETCAASFISSPFDIAQNGTVGPPLPHTELRLEAVPEMGYDPNGSPPRGEILIRGPGVFSGYHRADEITREVIDEEGFFHTGDVGEITPSGALKIIDRKKNIFKLSHGEYIAVERIENVFKVCPIVEQLWVYGSSFESQLVAVIVPKEESLRAVLRQKGVPNVDAASIQELSARKDVREAVIQELTSVGKAAKLKGFEFVKNVHLDPEPFSVENDLLTPSFKLKRAPLQKKYKTVLDNMYNELKNSP